MNSKSNQWQDLYDFFEEARKGVLPPKNELQKDYLNNYMIQPNQCIYVFDFAEVALRYKRNFQMLGYEDNEVTWKDIAAYHPEDKELVETVTMAAISYGLEHKVTPFDTVFCLTYRLRQKDGTYKKVMRQTTVFEVDQNGEMYANLSILTDVEFINTPGYVNWTFQTDGLDREAFEAHVCKAVHNIFTKKEKELIPAVVDGKSSPEIADQLCISRHTVDTHRRNILRKSGCKNTFELIEFATKNKLV